MPEKNKLNPIQQELENALSSLKPAALNLDRDKLMFRAGQSSARRQNFAWPAVAVLLAVMLGASLLYRPPAQTERIVYVPQPATPDNTYSSLMVETERPPRSAQYIHLRDKILAEGMDALPESTGSTGENQDELWRELDKIIPFNSKIKGILNQNSNMGV